MDNAGQLLFGVKPDRDRGVVTSPGTYSNDVWHHVVATLSKTSGMKLYVDGTRSLHERT